MGKRLLSRAMPRLAVVLGATALIALFLWGGGGSGLARPDYKVYLPLVMKAPPASLEDHFDTDANNWTAYTDYWRLNKAQWFWDANGGYQGGGYRHNKNLGGAEAHDALSMYLVGNSQEWTDYRLQAKVNLVSGNVIGVWFRGTYEDVGLSGRRFTGYYCTINPGGNRVTLSRMRTENECADPPCPYLYDFRNPLQLTQVTQDLYRNRWYTLKVEVQGSLIKCYVDDVLKIEYNDTVSGFLQGTVGFYVYKAGDARFDDVLVEPL